MLMRLRILPVLAKKKAIHYHVDLFVKVFEENPETSFAEDGGYRIPIKDVQGGGQIKIGWLCLRRRGSEFLTSFVDVKMNDC